MGIPFKLYEGKEVNLPAELTAGGIYFCEDSGNVFIDVDIDGTLTRIHLGKKYIYDQLKDVKEFIENQGSGIEIDDEPPTKESANVWINTKDEDEEGVEYLGVVTSINGKGGDVNIAASDIDAAEKTHAAQHASGGSDPITPAAIGAINSEPVYWGSISQKSADDLTDPLALIVCTDSLNSELYYKIGSLAYVMTAGYGESKFQVAWPYYARSGMATRSRKSGTWSKWADFATTDYALNKAGDTMTGALGILHDDVATALDVDGSTKTSYWRVAHDSKWSQLIFNESMLQYALSLDSGSTWAIHDILHAGNKPTRAYGGNATTQDVDIGGIGNCAIVWGTDGTIFLATPNGAFGRDGANHDIIFSTDVAFYNGKLSVVGSGPCCKSGIDYLCQVL